MDNVANAPPTCQAEMPLSSPYLRIFVCTAQVLPVVDRMVTRGAPGLVVEVGGREREGDMRGVM